MWTMLANNRQRNTAPAIGRCGGAHAESVCDRWTANRRATGAPRSRHVRDISCDKRAPAVASTFVPRPRSALVGRPTRTAAR